LGRGAKLSELLDKLIPESGSQPGGGGGSGGPSAFDRFLGTLIPGKPPGDEFDRALLYAALGSALTIASAVVLALLPSRETILGSGFYTVGRRTLANVMGVAGDAAMPIAIFGVVLLLLTGLIALVGRRDGFTGMLCVAQPVVGVGAMGGAGLGWLALLAVIAVNLLIWIVLITLVVVIGFAFLFGMLGAALDG
jgi:hypothetical protein